MSQVYKNDFLVDKSAWYKVSISFPEENMKGLLKIFNSDNTNQLFPTISFPNKVFLTNESKEYNIFYFNNLDKVINIYGLGFDSTVKVYLTKVDMISKFIDSNKVKDIPNLDVALYYMKIFNKSGHIYNKMIEQQDIIKNPLYLDKILETNIHRKEVKKGDNKLKVILVILDNLTYLYMWIGILSNSLRSLADKYSFVIVSDLIKIKDLPPGIKIIKIKDLPKINLLTISEYISTTSQKMMDTINKEDIYSAITDNPLIALSLSKIQGFSYIFLDTNTNINTNDKVLTLAKSKALFHIIRKDEGGVNINKINIPYSFDSNWQVSDRSSSKIKICYIGFDTEDNIQNILTLLKAVNGHGYIINLILPEPILNNKQIDNYKKGNTIIINIVSDYYSIPKFCKDVSIFVFLPTFNENIITNITCFKKPIVCHNSYSECNIPNTYNNISELPKILKILKDTRQTHISYGILSDIAIKEQYVAMLEQI